MEPFDEPDRPPDSNEPDGASRGEDSLLDPGVLEFRRRALAFGFGFVVLGSFALLVAIYLQLAHQILWASTLAVLFYPLHRRILSLVGGRVTLASTISTLLSLAILFIPAVLLVFNLVNEVRSILPGLSEGFGVRAYQGISEWVERSPFRGLAHLFLTQDPGQGAKALEVEVAKAAAATQDFLLEQLRTVTKSIPAAAFQFIVTVVAFFFFLRHGPGWIRALQQILPLRTVHSERLVTIAGQSVNAVFRGVILTAAAQGLLAGLGFWVAGTRMPILLGGLTFIGSLIPFVGAVAVWLPTSVILGLTGRPGAAIGLAIWGTLVISLADNFLKPYLIGREMRLPTLWLFLAIIGAIKLFGFLGIVVGPAALSLAFACYRIYTEGRKIAG